MKSCLSLIFLPLFVLPGSLHAAEKFQLSEETVHSEEGGDSIQQVLLTQSNKVSFVSPSTWSINASAEKKTIILLAPDQIQTITIRFTERNPALQPQSKPEALREQVMGRYPGAKTVITEQFVCYTASGSGRAFDLELQSGEVTMAVRLAFVPFENGTVEFVLQAHTEQLQAQHNSFSDLLNSFQIESALKTSAK